MKTKLKPVAYILAAAFALAAAGIAAYAPATQAADEKKQDAPKAALTVTTTKPSAASLPIKLAANGNVAAWQEASVSSESNGLRLTEVRVNVGDVVKAGDVLAVFSPKPSTPTWPRPKPPCTKPKPMPPTPPPTPPAPARCKTPAP
jgi:multidrug efflux pump subunit AcrA (membrane-fusion protein)